MATPAVSIPLQMFILFVSAKFMAEIAERLGQPAVAGEILAGVLIGPSVLSWVTPDQFLSAMSDLGAMFLLFRVGLEVRASSLLRVGGTATLVASSGVVIPFILGAAIMLLQGSGPNEAIFVGAALVATSVGITAHVLSANGLLGELSSRVVLAAAVIDDVLGLLVLAVVSSLANGRFNLLQLSMTALLALAFTVIVARWGTHAVGHVAPWFHRKLKTSESRFVLSLGLMFGLAWAAAAIGIAAIVGAFLAGLALAETAGPRERDLTQGVSELLVPFFLAGVGLHMDLSVFLQPSTAILALLILAAAVASKFFGCALGAVSLGRKDAIRIGVGMIPRGEVGMIVAQIGLASGILTRASYGVVVFMSVATTIIAPPLIKLAYSGVRRRSAAGLGEEALRLV